MVNKAMIAMHIVAYFVIMIANILDTAIPFSALRASGISNIITMVLYFVCIVIFGLILN